MPNEIQDLEDRIIAGQKLSLLLPQAIAIAKRHDEKFVPWLENEFNGYNQHHTVPGYRSVPVHFVRKNSFGLGLEALNLSDKKLAKYLSKLGFTDPIVAIESMLTDMIANKKPHLYLDFPPEAHDKDYEIRQGDCFRQIGRISLYNLLDSVRSKLLAWVSELNQTRISNNISDTGDLPDFFGPELMAKLPPDIKRLTDDFNFNYSDGRAFTCMLILRRILPLAIIRKFQQENVEPEIQTADGYIDTEALLGQVNNHFMKHKQRLYKSLDSDRMLLNASQHLAGFKPEIVDVRQTATTIKLFLGEMFAGN